MWTFIGQFIFVRMCQHQREIGCHPSRGSRKAERPRLENSQRARRQSVVHSVVILCIVGTVGFSGLFGCGTSVEIPNPIPILEKGSYVASEILLEVEDSAVTWGGSEAGKELQRRLVENGTFKKVHYPIYPTHHVPLRLRVVVRGTKEEDSAGFGKAMITGLLMFIPVGMIQYEDKFILTADVSVNRKDQTFGPLKIESIVEADHTMFSNAENYYTQARELAWEDLARRISLAFKKHPSWFSQP